MPAKSVLPRGFKTTAEKLSEQYRKEMGISIFAPLDAFALADYLDVQVFSVDEMFIGKLDHPEYQTMSDTQRFSAMRTYNKAEEKLIIHNTNHSPYRQQSNLMHELAHFIRNHEISDEVAQACAQFNLHYYNPLHEEEAKFLGGCLQITIPGLRWKLKNHCSIEHISEYYNASIEMVKYRIKITGVQKQYGQIL
ncbi:MAG TPA: ImmA/IrrE family metallo-endopeptidase [Chitinophagaceae bacterium]